MDWARRDFLRVMGWGAVGSAATAVNATWLEECQASHSVSRIAGSDALDAGEDAPLLRILYNENPMGCSPLAREALQQLSSATQYYRFQECRALVDQLRDLHGMSPLPDADSLSFLDQETEQEYLLELGVGSSELLKALTQAVMSEGGNVVEPNPSYRAVGRAALSVNAASTVKRVEVDGEGRLNLKAMLAAVDRDTRLVVITNPNNPTGSMLPREAIESFVDQIPETTMILIDEAYLEYADQAETLSAVSLATSRRNVLVTRTFSKLYGLAGLRLGYGIGHRELMGRMKPYLLGAMGVNAAAVFAASASLGDSEHGLQTRNMVHQFRQSMEEVLPNCGFRVLPGVAPFVWAEAKQDVTSLVEKLAAENILIASGSRWDRPDCVRISAATPGQTQRLVEAIQRHAL